MEFDLEDPGSSPHLNLQTLYSYNALGNLTKVLKCNAGGSGNTCAGQARSFSYDQLGRQTQAINPESGTVNYSYVLAGDYLPKFGLARLPNAVS